MGRCLVQGFLRQGDVADHGIDDGVANGVHDDAALLVGQVGPEVLVEAVLPAGEIDAERNGVGVLRHVPERAALEIVGGVRRTVELTALESGEHFGRGHADGHRPDAARPLRVDRTRRPDLHAFQVGDILHLAGAEDVVLRRRIAADEDDAEFVEALLHLRIVDVEVGDGEGCRHDVAKIEPENGEGVVFRQLRRRVGPRMIGQLRDAVAQAAQVRLRRQKRRAGEEVGFERAVGCCFQRLGPVDVADTGERMGGWEPDARIELGFRLCRQAGAEHGAKAGCC